MSDTPPGRTRKRTIISESHPEIPDGQTNISEEGIEPNSKAAKTCPAICITPDTPEGNDHEDYGFKTQNQDDQYNHTHKTNDTNGIHTADTNSNEHNDDDVFVEQNHAVKERVDEVKQENKKVLEPVSDVIYDETKPRRLSHPKPLKVNIKHQTDRALHDSIGHLISPDSPDGGRGGGSRRQRKLPPSDEGQDEPRSQTREQGGLKTQVVFENIVIYKCLQLE